MTRTRTTSGRRARRGTPAVSAGAFFDVMGCVDRALIPSIALLCSGVSIQGPAAGGPPMPGGQIVRDLLQRATEYV